jgi:hypothetical protein
MDLVNRLTMAVQASTRHTPASPTGISVLPILRLSGTFQPRSPLYLKRSTSMEEVLKTKLQMTPKA